MRRYLFGAAAGVAVWWILSLLINSEIILPSPMAVLGSLNEVIKSKEFYTALVSTVLKGLLSTSLVIFIGTSVGMLMGLKKGLSEALKPFVTLLQSVPVVSWLALAIFLWGIGWKGPVLLTTLSLLPVVIINTYSGVLNVDTRLIEMAKVYGVEKKKVFKYIYLGSLLPFMLASLRITLGNVWKTVLVTEFLCGDRGIGVMIAWARSYVDTPKIFALTLIGVTLAVSFERAGEGFFERVLKRWKLS